MVNELFGSVLAAGQASFVLATLLGHGASEVFVVYWAGHDGGVKVRLGEVNRRISEVGWKRVKVV